MFTFALDGLRWLRDAACLNEDAELFFPLAETGPANERQIAQAKAVCAGCPVKTDCLRFALDNGLDEGVFGGLTPEERRKLVRTRT